MKQRLAKYGMLVALGAAALGFSIEEPAKDFSQKVVCEVGELVSISPGQPIVEDSNTDPKKYWRGECKWKIPFWYEVNTNRPYLIAFCSQNDVTQSQVLHLRGLKTDIHLPYSLHMKCDSGKFLHFHHNGEFTGASYSDDPATAQTGDILVVPAATKPEFVLLRAEAQGLEFDDHCTVSIETKPERALVPTGQGINTKGVGLAPDKYQDLVTIRLICL